MGIPLIIGGAILSGIGQAIKNRQAAADAKARVDARNKVLADTMAMNKPLAQSSRDQFDARMAGPIADETAPSLRSALLADAAAPPAEAVPVAGNAPEVVKSEMAGQMAKAIEAGRAEAAASARVGSYGDAWFNEGVYNNDLSSRLGQNANFAGGNLALLPHLQDLAEVDAVKRRGPIADIFMGLGSALGSAGGSMGRRAPTSSPSLFDTARQNFPRP